MTSYSMRLVDKVCVSGKESPLNAVDFSKRSSTVTVTVQCVINDLATNSVF